MSKISVIVPVYNVEKHLKRCIDSLISQTYSNLEIILVDDGSTDSSPEICDAYADKDTRVKVIHKKNGGLSDACNKGLMAANGDYIAFVDSDDYLHMDMYKILVDEINAKKADMGMCLFERVYDEYIEPKPVERYETDLLSIEDIYKEWHHVETNVRWNKLFKREILKGIEFPYGKINEDEATKPKIYERLNKIVKVNEKLYFYQQSNTSITRKEFYPKKMDKLDAIYENIKWFKDNKLTNYLNEEVKYYWDYFLDYYKKCMFYEGENIKDKLITYKKQFNKMYPLILRCPLLSAKNKLTVTLMRISPRLLYRLVK